MEKKKEIHQDVSLLNCLPFFIFQQDRPNTSPRRPSRSRVSSALGSPSQGIQLNNTVGR